MNGGGGGYHRPSGGNGSGDEEDSSEDEEPSSVPTPDKDPDVEPTEPGVEEPDEESGGSDGEPERPPKNPPPSSGDSNGGIPGGPPVDPGTESSDTGEKEDGPEEEPEEEQLNGPEEELPKDQNQGTADQEESRRPESNDSPNAQKSDQSSSESDQPEDDENGDSEQNSEKEEEGEDDEDKDEDDEECLLTESAQLHSPNPSVLEEVTEREIYSVELREESVCVIDRNGQTIGAITEPWVETIKECLRDGWQYRAQIIELEGGYCRVRITNKCHLSNQIDLISVNQTITDGLYPGRIFPVEATDQGKIIVIYDDSRIGAVPDPWADLIGECINRGQTYQAEVVEVASERCRVTIRNGPIDE